MDGDGVAMIVILALVFGFSIGFLVGESRQEHKDLAVIEALKTAATPPPDSTKQPDQKTPAVYSWAIAETAVATTQEFVKRVVTDPYLSPFLKNISGNGVIKNQEFLDSCSMVYSRIAGMTKSPSITVVSFRILNGDKDNTGASTMRGTNSILISSDYFDKKLSDQKARVGVMSQLSWGLEEIRRYQVGRPTLDNKCSKAAEDAAARAVASWSW